ncbi:hypothetical protein CLOM_g8210 [Closterium sp. NIES-68]|nr:hypothetical protein CLOM_g8210 [Closterium sp. NIES-68]GJP66117.1 hypothetical protein CLOP_g23032 [Closterium sp. NIES-67]
MGASGNKWGANATCNVMSIGLVCNKDGTVNTISLPSSNLHGSICSAIGNLTTLVTIDLSSNSLKGPIPASIGQLSLLQTLHVGANSLSGEILPKLASLTRLKFLDIAENRFSGNIPAEFGALTNLQHVNLAGNGFQGRIPAFFANLTNLKMLSFQNNQFSGEIPSGLGTLINLTDLSFAQNKLSGTVPPTLGNLTRLKTLSFAKNTLSGTFPPTLGSLTRLTTLGVRDSGANCSVESGQSCVVKQTSSSLFCYWCSDFCSYCVPISNPLPMAPPPSSPPSSGLSLGAIIGIVVGGILVIGLLAIGMLLLYKRRSTKAPEKSNPQAGDGSFKEESSMPSHAHMCQRYSFAEVSKATDNWAEANHIGTGGYGEVYRGVSPSDPSVVWGVKRAKILTNDFRREVEEMASKSHPNLVRLLGYCVHIDMATEHHEQIVIYEFCSNGDLEKYLSGGPKKGSLSLEQRMEVVVGVARGLEYLHQFDIVHRDIKPANVLLDANMQAKVSDFGLVRMTEGTTVNPTRVVGTPGYVDPAYSRTNKATPMADVHSFGVMMLEIMLTKPVVMHVNGGTNIRDWVAERVQLGEVDALKDPHLDTVPSELLLKLVELALQCTSLPASSRPHMTEVVAQLVAMKREFVKDGGSAKKSRMQKIDDEVAMRKTGSNMEEELELLDEMLG